MTSPVAMPKEMECYLTQDLLVPYVAGDIRLETKAWIDAHVSRCAACHAALRETAEAAGATIQVPPPMPPADTGRAVVGRVRRNVAILVGVVVICLALAAGSITFGVQALRKLADMPADLPVPSASVTPVEAVRQTDLRHLELTAGETQVFRDGVTQLYTTPGGQTVTLQVQRFDTESDASQAYRAWNGRFRVKTTSVEFNLGSGSSAKFLSQGQYHTGWQRGPWLIIISVPKETPSAADLRDAIRDSLYTAFQP